MEYSALKSLIEQRKTIKQISDILKVSQTNVRYWIKKHGLKTARGPHGSYTKDYEAECKCYKCGETNPEKFYGHKRSICGSCHNKYNAKKGKEQRQFIIEYLGGSCKSCGYNIYPCSLDVHHKIPEEKDVSFGTARYWNKQRLISELNKCILLCKNCHAAHHGGYEIY